MMNPKKMPTVSGNSLVGNAICGKAISAYCSAGRLEDKEFSTLRAEFALRGHALHRSAATDGSTTYWAERWGLVRCLPSMEDARLFLEQIGG